MTRNQLDLLRSRRFLPLFITQALGAFNDNLFKSAIIFLVTYVMAERSGLNAPLLVAVAGGIFIFPFFLFSASAGQLAEKYDKARLIRLLKLTELGLMLAAAVGFMLGSVWFLMVVLFLMGAQSAYFGPTKYGILPEQLKSEELIGGNAWVQGGTFVAILLGTLFGKLVLEQEGILIVSALVVGMAVLGWLASRFIPTTGVAAPQLQVDYNVFTATWDMMRYAAGRRDIFLTILGVSWFWLVGATILAEITPFAKDVLGGDENLASLFLMLFSIGMALGSLLCNSILKGEIHATFVPFGALALSIFIIDLYFASRHGFDTGAGLVGISAFLDSFTGWRIALDILLIAVAGGVYIVPLNTIVQHRSEQHHRARNIAANNIFNALFMVVSALGTVLLLSLGLSIPQLFLVVALLNLAVAVYITRLLPGALARAIIAWLLQMFYRVEVTGLRHLREAGERVLIVANHQSFLDPPLIAAYVPEDLTFAIDTFVAKDRMLKYFLSLARTIPIDATNPLSTRALIEAIRQGEKVVIFPEGRITVTGSLMQVFEGPGMVADKAGARIVPVRLEGAQYSPFSRLRGKVRIRWFPRMRVAFQPPRELSLPPQLRSRERRSYAGRLLSDLMTGMMFESSDYRRTLFHSLLDAKEIHGAGHRVLEDVERNPQSYRSTLVGSFALGRAMAAQTAPGEHVGLLLPNAVDTVLAFFGLQAHGRVPAMLNFSAGARALVDGCSAAGVGTVYSSRRLVELGKLQELTTAVEAAGMRLHYLEDLKQGIGAGARLLALGAAMAPRLAYRFSCRDRDPESPAVILFTPGTEGSPKGVVLSHTNIQANRYQVASMIDFGPGDTVFNVLPLYQSYGFTCGTLLPILSGLKIFLYPSPLHYRIVPEMVYHTSATLLFGTETHLAGYARYANPYDFYSIRYVFTGVERLSDETRKVWNDRYGVRIFEGYGATETAPVLSMNSPMYNLHGSVGRLLPGIEHRLEPVPGIDNGGRLWVRGPNIMSGYLRAEPPGRLQPPLDGWYDTSDIVSIDADGFLTILDRAGRFARIDGETVSLAAVETMAAGLWPEHRHAVVKLPDPKKGERLVLTTDHPDADREALAAFAREQGIAAGNLPEQVLVVAEMPLLGSGKTDYRGVMELVEYRG